MVDGRGWLIEGARSRERWLVKRSFFIVSVQCWQYAEFFAGAGPNSDQTIDEAAK